MLLTHQINIPIYRKSISFILGDPQEVKDYIYDTTGYHCSFDETFTDGVEIHIGMFSWIWFDADKITPGILVHELGHAVFDLMDDIGLEKTDQEAFCYLQEYLFDECTNIFAIRMEVIKPPYNQEDDRVSS